MERAFETWDRFTDVDAARPHKCPKCGKEHDIQYYACYYEGEYTLSFRCPDCNIRWSAVFTIRGCRRTFEHGENKNENFSLSPAYA